MVPKHTGRCPIRRIALPFAITLFLFAGCIARETGDPEVEAILASLDAEYPLEELSEPLMQGALGGINMWAYCLSLGYPAVGYRKGYIEGPLAAHDNWVCQRGTEQLAPTDVHVVDLDAACSWQFGRDNIAARSADDDHAWSWSCYGT